MQILTQHPLIESIPEDWKDRIGDSYVGYRGHVYRMFNYCQARHPASGEEKTKPAIAACFHDTGLWSDHAADDLPPSIEQARQYLSETGRKDGSEVCEEDECGLWAILRTTLTAPVVVCSCIPCGGTLMAQTRASI